MQFQKIRHGFNLLPEGLETGEFKVQGTAEFDELEPINVIAYSGEEIPGLGGTGIYNITQGGFIINGMSSSVAFILCETLESYNILMNALQSRNYSDFIITSFTVPKLAVQDFFNNTHKIDALYDIPNIYILSNKVTLNNQQPLSKTLSGTPSNLDGYTPRNQKLKTYPYMYLGFNPQNGSSKIFRYENFENNITFKIISEVNPNPLICFIPQNYNGQSGDSLSDLGSLGGYPTIANKSDYFNTWLAQNSEIINIQNQQERFNYEVGYIQSLIGTGTNLLNSVQSENIGGVFNLVNSGLDMYKNYVNHDYYIKNQMAQIEKQKMLPDKINLSSSNSTLLGYEMIDKNIFTRFTIKRQYAERIDKFFDMYGYLTNKIKIPNINNRPNWNYVKTIGCNITANIPQEDLLTIKNIFDNGITLWHNTNTFLDYSQNNR